MLRLRLLLNLLLFSTTISLCGTEKDSTSETKIAIVAPTSQGELLADSVMTELAEQGIICLERTKIKKVLEEHKLSSSGLVNPADIINCSELLKVDLFAIVICSPKNKVPIGLIVFDTRFGIRLADICLPVDFNKQTSRAKTAVLQAVAKNKLVKDNKLKLISFMPLNQIALQKDNANSARLVELILMRLLGRNSDFLVLERNQLNFLIQERNLTPKLKSQLLAGSVFIQLEAELSGNKSKPLSLKLFLKDFSGNIRFSCSAPCAIDGEVIASQKLYAKISRQLNAGTSSSSFDCHSEADAFFQECRMAQANGMYDRASQMARNAYILNPRYLEKLIEIEAAICRSYLSHPGSSPPPGEVEKALGHAEFLFEINDGSERTEKLIARVMADFAKFNDYYFNKQLPPKLKVRISDLRQQTAALLLNSYKRKYKPITAVNSADDLKEIAKRIAVINAITEISRDNNINNRYGLPLKEMYIDNLDRFYEPKISLGYHGFDLFAPGRKPRPLPQLTKLYKAMQKSSVPYFKIIGTLHLHAINYPVSHSNQDYVNFLVDVIEHYDITDADWRYLRSFLCYARDNFIRMTLAKYSIKLCRAIYKKKGYDRELFCRMNINACDVPAIYSFMQEIQADAEKDKNMPDAARKKIIDGTEAYLKSLKVQFPKAAIAVRKTPDRTNRAFSRSFSILPSSTPTLSQPLHDGKYIYTVGINYGERFLYKISPENNFKFKLGLKLTLNAKRIENSHWEKYLACLSKKYYIMASSAGLFLFPLDLSAPKHLPLKEFSGFTCYSVACMNGNVYIAYNKSVNSRKTPLFLVEYKLQENSYSVIYASHQDDNNPFKDKDLDNFQRIYPDQVRKRLIIPACFTNFQSAELWSLNPALRSWQKLTTLPYYPKAAYDLKYNSFIIKKNKTVLTVLGVNAAYEFNTADNRAELIFFSGGNFSYYFKSLDFAYMKAYNKWQPLRPNWRCSSIKLVGIDGDKLLSAYRLILLKKKIAVNLVSDTSRGSFCYAYFKLDSGFIIGSNHNCIPNHSLIAVELKNEKFLQGENIAP